jgi:hypothetical protein
MPFDIANEQKLNRELLIRELRENPPDWWYYGSCRTCAIEVAAQLGIVKGSRTGGASNRLKRELAKQFGLPLANIQNSPFFGLREPLSNRSPAAVADALEALDVNRN